jgi:hypothetical protein
MRASDPALGLGPRLRRLPPSRRSEPTAGLPSQEDDRQLVGFGRDFGLNAETWTLELVTSTVAPVLAC